MIITTHLCGSCSSDQLRRNGSSQGHAKYQCKACGHQARLVPAAVAKAAQYAQVDKLLEERNSQRSIVRLTGVSRVSIAKRLKKSGASGTRFAAATTQKGAKKAVGSTGIRRDVDICGAKKA
ncbi:MAG: transposase-like zinc-binding domain-containing protein [Janthinobacterium lividum]